MAQHQSEDRKHLSLQGRVSRRTMMVEMARFTGTVAGAFALLPRIHLPGIHPMLPASEPPVVETSSGKIRGAIGKDAAHRLRDHLHALRIVPSLQRDVFQHV